MFNKRADITIGTILLIVIILLFLGWIINESWKECRVDADCKSNQYCTSSFTCKDVPVVEKTSPAIAADLTAVAWIIGLCLIIAAAILRWDSISATFKKKDIRIIETQKREEEPPKEAKKKDEYIDLSKSYRAEADAYLAQDRQEPKPKK
jgi:hypothetical protein